MAIQKQVQPGKEIKQQGGESLGVSLSSLNQVKSVPLTSESKKHNDDIKAYQHDALRSVVICLIAVGIELALYFSNVIK